MQKIMDFLILQADEARNLLRELEQPRDSTKPARWSHPDFTRRLAKLKTNVDRAFSYAELKPFALEMLRTGRALGGPAEFLPNLAGIVESAIDCLRGGFVGQLKHLLHAEMFDSTIAQAKGLLDAGHQIPAAVLARIVIEDWIRDEAEKAGLPDWQKAKASVLNDGLKGANVFTQPKWRLIQKHLDVGNLAAHGKDAEFTEADVRSMIEFAESNCL